MKNKIRCEKCHLFYDVDKYAECPHCNKKDDSKTEVVSDVKPSDESKEKTWAITEAITDDSNESSTLIIDAERVSGSSGEKTESFFQKRAYSTPQGSIKKQMVAPVANESDEKTQSIFDVSEKQAQADSLSTVSNQAHTHYDDDSTQSWFATPATKHIDKPKGEEITYETESVFSDPVTVPLENNQTKAKQPVELIAGWIVCVKGKRFGESFTISAGKNSIGRAPGNKIAILNDTCISRDQHAFILYDPMNRKFYLQPGNSSGLTYLNRQIVLVPTELKDRDEIGLNESRFIFIPLCNESFSWDAIKD